ncbi:NAD(P)H-quinone oxidoreductase [uncultured Mucilaginibacter sp.]|uniref:NAD(P)H-quinone oxidoreductase n=1 Tax=uncultured Mucilaginibacter sp. TaxID=797541 RepID=UPI0025E482B1|nr:NAD(P)H-quinone oxidoreductase [uncultured Mucilaginibacter sp.]
MKAIIIPQPGGPEVFEIGQCPTPQPAAGEVLIKVAAAGINRPDIAQRKGIYPPPPGASDIPGLEIAGTITALGEGVERWHIGDKVCGLVSGGGYAEYCTIPEGQCLPIPENLSLAEAASLPETYFTVWSNVFDRAKLLPGETLLVHGGTSGIGVAAIQMAKALGSTVYITAGSDEKCKFCEQLGATKAINYKTENFRDAIKLLTGSKGVNVILDMVGGDYTPDNIKSLGYDGRLVVISALKGKDATIDLNLITHKRLTITGSALRVRDVAFKSAIARNLEQHIWPLLASGQIKPVLYKTFPFGDVAGAHRLMESSEHIGKIVLTFGD